MDKYSYGQYSEHSFPGLPLKPRKMSTSSLFRIPSLDGLVFGRTIGPATKGASNEIKHVVNGNASTWKFFPGTYVPYEVVDHVAPLLDSLLIQLGQDPPGAVPSRVILINGLHSCLSIEGRESVLPIARNVNLVGRSARQEMANQAQRIGSFLVRCAQKVSPHGGFSPRMSIRSPCEGYVWTEDVAALLIGPRSNGNLMQIYNEWLHQIVLLRDSLLPFENFEKVSLIMKSHASQGMRPLEDIRSILVMQIMTAQVKPTTLIDVAKVFTAPELPPGGYGFQYTGGIVVPISLLGGSSSILLRYVPAIVDDSQHQELLFGYENKDYFSDPRKKITAPAEPFWSTSSTSAIQEHSLSSRLASSSLVIEGPTDGNFSSRVRLIKLQGTFEDNTRFSVDLGQVTRGLRYAYRILPADIKADSDSVPPDYIGLHRASDMLSLPDLVTYPFQSKSLSLHVIKASNAVVRMALLGRLYPENIILLDREEGPLAYPVGIGKGFGPKIVIVGGSAMDT